MYNVNSPNFEKNAKAIGRYLRLLARAILEDVSDEEWERIYRESEELRKKLSEDAPDEE